MVTHSLASADSAAVVTVVVLLSKNYATVAASPCYSYVVPLSSLPEGAAIKSLIRKFLFLAGPLLTFKGYLSSFRPC